MCFKDGAGFADGYGDGLGVECEEGRVKKDASNFRIRIGIHLDAENCTRSKFGFENQEFNLNVLSFFLMSL